jgi:hypothetical protein
MQTIETDIKKMETILIETERVGKANRKSASQKQLHKLSKVLNNLEATLQGDQPDYRR